MVKFESVRVSKLSRGRPAGNFDGSEVHSALGYLIGTARASKKLSLKIVASALGVSVQFVSNIEHGRAPLPSKYVPTLSSLLGLSSDTLAATAIK